MARESKRKRDEKRFGKPERLIDRIRFDGVRKPQWVKPSDEAAWKDVAGAFIDVSGNVPCFVVDNVAAYAGDHFDAIKRWDILPPCSPPFENFWVEATNPYPQFPELKSFGFLFLGSNSEDDRKQAATAVRNRNSRISEDDPRRHPADLVEKSRFIFTTEMAVELKSGVIFYSVQTAAIFFGDTGDLLVMPLAFFPFKEVEATEDADMAPMALLHIALLSLGFMNCKNVAKATVEPDARLNRERERNGLKPFLRYHTINIDPMKTALRTEGGIETNGLQKALHICRGHFATYGDSFMGRKLAEPITVWRPSHVRGSAKEGVVLSDYEVKAPSP